MSSSVVEPEACNASRANTCNRDLDALGAMEFGAWMYLIDSKMVGEAGIEPTTPGLEGRCSIRLSYSPTLFIIVSAKSPVHSARRWGQYPQ